MDIFLAISVGFIGYTAGVLTMAFVFTSRYNVQEKTVSVDDHFYSAPIEDPIYQQVKKDRCGPNPFIQ